MPKVILISQHPLPFSTIASWTTMYKHYLQKEGHSLDFIICPPTDKLFEKIGYSFVAKKSFLKNIISKVNQDYNWKNYLNALDKIIQSDEKYIIQVLDNSGFVTSLSRHINLKYNRQNFYVQFFYHGFYPFLERNKGEVFFEAVDEMIVLTNDSYKVHKEYYNELPCRFSFLHNGIDTRIFKKVSLEEKKNLKEKYNASGKTVFVWCSQDRPKKGLNLILDVWQKVYERDKEIILWVIGSNEVKTMEGVMFFGKIPNDDLPNYYQAADVYLFPTLWQEGFGLSLVEALHCGCYCIASALGGVPEVLQYGGLGKLIENPHFISEWEVAIEEYLTGNVVEYEFSSDLYTLQNWNEGMNAIIQEAKCSLNNTKGNLLSK